ncbi:MAG TPA: hypothetical protein VFD92_06840 [Candidatus Binatia bacterium]|nr:hypothetical protein [Candidatus Binatia bacterium]
MTSDPTKVGAPAEVADWHDVPRLAPPAAADALERFFAQLAVVVLRHPVAAQAAFCALVAEGRRFSQTEEGRRWRDALACSELVRRGRALWEGSVLNLLVDDPDALLPSGLVDAIAHAASRGDLGDLLGELLGAGASRGPRP